MAETCCELAIVYAGENRINRTGVNDLLNKYHITRRRCLPAGERLLQNRAGALAIVISSRHVLVLGTA